MTTGRLTSFAQRRTVRATAVTALVLAPLAAVPVLMVTGAAAASGGATACADPLGALKDYSVDAATASGTVTLQNAACAGMTVSLVAYTIPGTSPSADAYPQTLIAGSVKSVRLDTVGTAVSIQTTLLVNCHVQVDLVTGDDPPVTLQSSSTLGGTFVAGDVTSGTDCSTPPPTTTPPPPPTTSTTPTPPPTTSTTPTPPPTTSTTPPPPPTTSTTPPPTTSTTPPPTTSTTPPPTTSSEPPTTVSTSVLPTVTTKMPTTTPTSSTSVSVLPFATTREPDVAGVASSLPYTGSALPVRDAVLTALALLFVGAAMILFAGRSRTARKH